MGKPTGITPGLSVSDPKEYQRQYDANNSGEKSKRAKQWAKDNPERFKGLLRAYRASDRGRASTKRHVLKKMKKWRVLVDSYIKPCMDCGASYPSYVMDFHHRNPEDKLFTIGQSSGKSKDAIIAEIAKCDVICSNCHRERHHGR